MPDRLWPGTITTALPISTNQDGSDKVTNGKQQQQQLDNTSNLNKTIKQ